MADKISNILKSRKRERDIDRLQRMSRYRKLDKDKTIQKQYKKYVKMTHPNARLSKELWYDLNYSDAQVKEPRIAELYMW